MRRYTQLALMLCVAVAVTAVEARADCHNVRGSISETSIPSNDQLSRLLGTVTGVLNGGSTVFITSPPPNRRFSSVATVRARASLAPTSSRASRSAAKSVRPSQSLPLSIRQRNAAR